MMGFSIMGSGGGRIRSGLRQGLPTPKPRFGQTTANQVQLPLPRSASGGAALTPPIAGLRAFTPGGQAEMSTLAIATGADLRFVIVHHLTRIRLVILGAPILFCLILTRREAPASERTVLAQSRSLHNGTFHC